MKLFIMKTILIFNTAICVSQPNKKESKMEHLRSKNKQELLEIALEILKDKKPSLVIDFDEFEGTAWKNSKKIVVKFIRYIRFIPLHTDPERFSYDITVNLNTTEILPFDDFFKLEFYIETSENKMAIEFIKKNFGCFSVNFENTIYEGGDDYFIDIKNQYSFGKYTVNKKTGIVKTEIQASYEPMSRPIINEDPDILTEIK